MTGGSPKRGILSLKDRNRFGSSLTSKCQWCGPVWYDSKLLRSNFTDQRLFFRDVNKIRLHMYGHISQGFALSVGILMPRKFFVVIGFAQRETGDGDAIFDAHEQI